MKRLFILIILCVCCVGCTTQATKQNHDSSLAEMRFIFNLCNEAINQANAGEDGSAAELATEIIPHLDQQTKHMLVTQEWIGTPDQFVDHDHEKQDIILAQAKSDLQLRKFVSSIWNKALTSVPWIASLTGVGGGLGLLLLKFGRTYLKYKGGFNTMVHGAEMIKEKADANGMLHRDTINTVLTQASSVGKSKSFREGFKEMVATAKEGWTYAKGEIDGSSNNPPQ